jgi:hypothetical protein
MVPIGSIEARAWSVLCSVAPIEAKEYGAQIAIPHDLSAQVLAMAQAASARDWIAITEDQTRQVAAWRELLNSELAHKARPELITNRGMPRGLRGFKAPWPWPPGKDGGVPPAHREAA